MTPEQLRDEAFVLEREDCDVMKVDQRRQIRLLRAHAAALEEIERLNGELAELKELLIEKTKVERGYRDAFVKAERRAERLNAAIRWALGYEDWPERGIGEGPFYWREELSRRAEKGE